MKEEECDGRTGAQIETWKNYTVPELAQLSGWSENTVRNLFRHHPLVSKKSGPTRQRVAIRIPGTVALQVLGDMQREPIIVKPQKRQSRQVEYIFPERHSKAVAEAETRATARENGA